VLTLVTSHTHSLAAGLFQRPYQLQVASPRRQRSYCYYGPLHIPPASSKPAVDKPPRFVVE